MTVILEYDIHTHEIIVESVFLISPPVNYNYKRTMTFIPYVIIIPISIFVIDGYRLIHLLRV
jgi:hypothetical protein